MNHPNGSLNIGCPRILPTSTTTHCGSLIRPPTFIRPNSNVNSLLYHFGTLRVREDRRRARYKPTPASSVTSVLRYDANLTNSGTSALQRPKRQLFILQYGGPLFIRFYLRLFGNRLYQASTIQRRIISVSLGHAIPLMRNRATTRRRLRTLFKLRARPPHVKTRRRDPSTNNFIPRKGMTIPTPNILRGINGLTPRNRVRRGVVRIRRVLSMPIRNES